MSRFCGGGWKSEWSRWHNRKKTKKERFCSWCSLSKEIYTYAQKKMKFCFLTFNLSFAARGHRLDSNPRRCQGLGLLYGAHTPPGELLGCLSIINNYKWVYQFTSWLLSHNIGITKTGVHCFRNNKMCYIWQQMCVLSHCFSFTSVLFAALIWFTADVTDLHPCEGFLRFEYEGNGLRGKLCVRGEGTGYLPWSVVPARSRVTLRPYPRRLACRPCALQRASTPRFPAERPQPQPKHPGCPWVSTWEEKQKQITGMVIRLPLLAHCSLANKTALKSRDESNSLLVHTVPEL